MIKKTRLGGFFIACKLLIYKNLNRTLLVLQFSLAYNLLLLYIHPVCIYIHTIK